MTRKMMCGNSAAMSMISGRVRGSPPAMTKKDTPSESACATTPRSSSDAELVGSVAADGLRVAALAAEVAPVGDAEDGDGRDGETFGCPRRAHARRTHLPQDRPAEEQGLRWPGQAHPDELGKEDAQTSIEGGCGHVRAAHACQGLLLRADTGAPTGIAASLPMSCVTVPSRFLGPWSRGTAHDLPPSPQWNTAANGFRPTRRSLF